MTAILVLYGLVCLITILVQVMAAAQKLDMSQLAGNRESLPSLTGLAGRLDRAQMNSVVAMALFAPAALLLIVTDQVTGFAVTIGWLFLLARIAYVVVYAMGIPWVRTLVWLIGFGATFILYLMAL